MGTALLFVFGSLGLFLGTANPFWHMPPLILLWPLCVAFLGLRAGSPYTAFRHGWFCSLLGSAAALYWVAVPMQEVGQIPLVLAIPCVVVLGAASGLFEGFFALMAYGVRRSGPTRQALVLGLSWFLLEWVRGWILTGFPWLGLAGAFAPWPFAIQGASFLGTFGLAGLFVALAYMGARSFPLQAAMGLPENGTAGQRRFLALLSVAGFSALIGFGLWRLEAKPLLEDEPVQIALIQGNIDQNVKWDLAMQRATVNTYMRLSKKSLEGATPPQLLIWPETAMPFDYERQELFSAIIKSFAARHDAGILFGTVGREHGGKVGEWHLTNRAHLVLPTGDAGWYEKEHLVPFGEYVPPWLHIPFLEFLLQGVGAYTPGTRIRPLTVPLKGMAPQKDGTESATHASLAKDAQDSALVLGVLICYEAVFPKLARQRVLQGANVLAVISNDAWFGYSSAPTQHLYLSLLRAVEEGRPIVRATNTGLSAFIDAYGQIQSVGGLFEETYMTGSVRAVRSSTLFFHVEPWLAPIALALLFLLLLQEMYRCRNRVFHR